MTWTRQQHEPGSGAEARSPAPLRVPFRARIRSRVAEYIGFAGLLVFSNLCLFAGLPGLQPAFLPAAIAAGEWWRVILHPFAHVSMYHLLLDGAAFFLLYHGLREPGRWRRLGFVAGAAAGSLFLSLWRSPEIAAIGLCGLSGVGHGLMAILALELIEAKDRMGWVCLAGVVAKAVWEAATGHVAFEGWHAGSVGVPIVMSHLGGILGAVMAWVAAHAFSVGVGKQRVQESG